MQMPISEVESHRVGSGLQKKKKKKSSLHLITTIRLLFKQTLILLSNWEKDNQRKWN